jgi:hypothetical protein
MRSAALGLQRLYLHYIIELDQHPVDHGQRFRFSKGLALFRKRNGLAENDVRILLGVWCAVQHTHVAVFGRLHDDDSLDILSKNLSATDGYQSLPVRKWMSASAIRLLRTIPHAPE